MNQASVYDFRFRERAVCMSNQALRMLPSFAPLPASFVRHLESYRQNLYWKRLQELEACPDARAFAEVRRDVYHRVAAAIEQGDLYTTWFARALSRDTPGDAEVRRQTLYVWRQSGVVRYLGDECPDPQNVAALLLARAFHGQLRSWLPEKMVADEPAWWCWLQLDPESDPYMCALVGERRGIVVSSREELHWIENGTRLVLPEARRLPSSALLWTPWPGAQWVDNTWLVVESLGAIRFVDVVDEQDLALWEPSIAQLGPGGVQSLSPSIFQTMKTLVLQLLAKDRLEGEQGRVSWKACPH